MGNQVWTLRKYAETTSSGVVSEKRCTMAVLMSNSQGEEGVVFDIRGPDDFGDCEDSTGGGRPMS